MIFDDHALVAVAAGHLVADLELAPPGHVDLDQLDHAGRQLVAAQRRARTPSRTRTSIRSRSRLAASKTARMRASFLLVLRPADRPQWMLVEVELLEHGWP